MAFTAASSANAEPSAEKGQKLYVRYCGSCHGATGNGRGPAAGVLETPPTDLTALGARYGRPLPADVVLPYIDGRKQVAAHGPREMPVWGRRLYFDRSTQGIGPSEEEVQDMLQSILLHLEAIQPGGPRAPRKSFP
jgi:mono/diheme cytochrome c family protein